MPENATIQIEIFISHSSADVEIASALVELIRAALHVAPAKIRCSSVDGYRLPGGAHTDQQLKRELRNAKAFIGLLTQDSLASTYVLFELGARWGAELHLTPLIAGTMEKTDLKPPLSGLNAHSCKNKAEIHQMLEELGHVLKSKLNSAAAYLKYVENLVALAGDEMLPESSWSLDLTPRFAQIIEGPGGTWIESSKPGSLQATLVTVTNEPFEDAVDLKNLQALITIENENQQGWRLTGCWLEHDSNQVSIDIGYSKDLIILLQDGNNVRAVDNKGASNIKRIFDLTGTKLRVRLRFMEAGEFLEDIEFGFEVNG